jgi:hypothetical protein
MARICHSHTATLLAGSARRTVSTSTRVSSEPSNPVSSHQWARSAIATTAVVDSFWRRVQTELLNRRRWRTRIEVANALFEYLGMFHDRVAELHPSRAHGMTLTVRPLRPAGGAAADRVQAPAERSTLAGVKSADRVAPQREQRCLDHVPAGHRSNRRKRLRTLVVQIRIARSSRVGCPGARCAGRAR